MSAGQPKTSTPSVQPRCPECGVVLVEGARSCWLCLTKLPDADGSVPVNQTAVARHAASDFSLSSLMMFVTLACVVLGVFTIAPGLGFVLAFIAFFAWLRTAIKIRRRSATEPAQTSEKIALFFQSVASVLLITGLVLLAGFAALFIACWVMIGGGHM